MLGTGAGSQLSTFCLDDDTFNQSALNSSYDVDVPNQLDPLPQCCISEEFETDGNARCLSDELEDFLLSSNEVPTPDVPDTSVPSGRENLNICTPSLVTTNGHNISSQAIVTNLDKPELQPDKINAEGLTSLNRQKRRFVQIWRPSRVHLSKRRRVQPRLTVPDIPASVTTDPSSTCNCPHESILQDLKNEHSGLKAELHGIKTQLTELQEVCASINSMVLSLQSNILQSKVTASDPGVSAASQNFSSMICSVPASTAFQLSDATCPNPVTILPPKLAPVAVQTGSFDGAVRSIPISNSVQQVSSNAQDTSIQSNTVTQLLGLDQTVATTASSGTNLAVVKAETHTSSQENTNQPNNTIELSSCIDQPNHQTNPTTLFQRPTADEVVQVAKTLDNLDTDVLRAQVKDVLRQNSVSQRLFGEVILGMCQASVSDLLSKPRSWSQLTEKARLLYVRMYMWLNQPDRMAALREASTSGNNVPKSTIRSQSQPGDNNTGADLPTPSQMTCLMKVDCESDKQEYVTLSKAPQDQNSKSKSELTILSSDSVTTFDEPVSDVGRQSLVDIAKAATVAMRRGSNSGPNHYTKVRSQTDQSSNSSATPTKREDLSTAPTTIVLGQLIGSDGEKECAMIDSPLKQSSGRNRVVFSPAQKQALIAEFARQPYPSSSSLRTLARELNLPFKPVVNWFHNRRMRSRQRFSTAGSTHDETAMKVTKKTSSAQTSSKSSGRLRNASSTLNGTQSNRRKRADPTRLLTETINSLLTSVDSDLIDSA